MRVTVRAIGVDEALRLLETVGNRVTNREPIRPLLEVLAQDWASTMQENIRTGAIPLPEWDPITVRIREHYGHAGKGKLIRGGDLLQSIVPLEFSDSGFVVGTDMEFAGVLFSGGEVTDRRGRTHEVPPWPFLVATDEMVTDAVSMIADWATGEAVSV